MATGTTPSTEAIVAAVDALHDEAIEMLADLVRFGSTLGNETAAQDFMAAAFAKLGLSVDRFEIDINDDREPARLLAGRLEL